MNIRIGLFGCLPVKVNTSAFYTPSFLIFSPALAVFLGGEKGSEWPADWAEAGEYDRGLSQVAQNAGGTLVGCPSSPTGTLQNWSCVPYMTFTICHGKYSGITI